jgi:antitoxin component YwqK of YwqJK toxin-antitoxin module
MPKKKPTKATEVIHYHKDGSVWAKGQSVDGVLTGYWEWFRKNGVIMRSGYFDNGVQVGEWTTYDKKGNVYKVTKMKASQPGSNQ